MINPNEIGSKTKNLQKLMEAGFKVPPFIAIPSSTLQTIISPQQDINQLNLKFPSNEKCNFNPHAGNIFRY